MLLENIKSVSVSGKKSTKKGNTTTSRCPPKFGENTQNHDDSDDSDKDNSSKDPQKNKNVK